MVIPLAAACAPDVLLGDPDAVRIGVSWSGSELAAFRAVLARIGVTYPVEVIPLGDETDSAFTAGGRSAPDIVMLPQAGRVHELAEQAKLQPVDAALWKDDEGWRYPDSWRTSAYYAGKPYAVPFKAADKSLVWYDRQLVQRYGLGDPATWTIPDWVNRLEVLAQTPIRLLALAAADGWGLTDFFENALFAESDRYYDALASAGDARTWNLPGVRAAFRHLGTLWGHRNAFPGGVGVALTHQFPDAVRDVFEHQRAVMVVAPDFAEPIVRRAVRDSGRTVAEAVGVVGFPAVAADKPRPQLVGGDVMVITAGAAANTANLVTALADPAAPVPWIEGWGGFLAPNVRTHARYSALLAPSAEALKVRSAFDLSDRIGAVGGRNGLWRILTDFLTTVGDGATDQVGVAIDDAINALDEIERRQR